MYQWLFSIIFFFLLAFRLGGQAIDTIEIEEITIQSSRLQSLIPADTLISKSGNKTSVPLHYTQLQLRENIPGGITIFNTRGTTPQQNTVYWAGLELNNPMLGLSDLSLFPPYLFDAIVLNQGSNPNLPFSGKPGGSLELVTSLHSEYEDGLNLSFSNLSSQNRNFTNLLKAGFSKGNTSIGINAAYSDYKNRYEFKHPNGTTRRQSHGRGIHRNLTAIIHHRINESSDITLNSWVQNTERQVPPTLFESSSSATQKDEAIRLAMHYRKQLKRSLFGFRPGLSRKVLNYSDPVSGEYSSSTITNLQVSTYWSGKFLASVPLRLEAIWRNQSINTDAYSINPTESDLLLSSSLRFANFLPNLNAAVYLRKTIGASANSPFLARFELSYVPQVDKKLYFSAENHHRNPTLNDLYWPVLGNPDLKPEKGHAFEGGFRFKNPGHGLKLFSAKLFYRKTDQLIYWSNHSGIWMPENLAAVNAYGLELEAKYSQRIRKLDVGTSLNYQYLKTALTEERFPGDPSKGKQLPYQPEHNLLGLLKISYKNSTLTINQKWTSTRYVASDHSQYLEPLFLFNAGIGHNFSLGPTILEVALFCDNILDREFFSVNRRPMPGRTFGIQITTKLNNEK